MARHQLNAYDDLPGVLLTLPREYRLERLLEPGEEDITEDESSSSPSLSMTRRSPELFCGTAPGWWNVSVHPWPGSDGESAIADCDSGGISSHA